MTDFLCWLRNDTAELSRAFVAAQSLLGLKEDVMRLILSILYKVLAAASGFSFFPPVWRFSRVPPAHLELWGGSFAAEGRKMERKWPLL